MASNERIAQIDAYVVWWRNAHAQSVKNLENLRQFKAMGISMIDEDGVDVLPDRIADEQRAVLAWSRGLAIAESLLARAQAGRDV